MAVISVPPDNQLAEDMLAIVNTYIRGKKCPSRRSKEMVLKQQQVKASLSKVKEKIRILGCFPLFHHFHPCEEAVTCDLEKNLELLVQEKKSFLEKQARELIAINVSDMSGNPSDSPHTILAATFLSSISLKAIGNYYDEKQHLCQN